MRVHVLPEARSHEQITPVSLCERNCLVELIQVPCAQFQGRELKPLQLHFVEIVQEWKVVSAFF